MSAREKLRRPEQIRREPELAVAQLCPAGEDLPLIRGFAHATLWNGDVCSCLDGGHFTIHLRRLLSTRTGPYVPEAYIRPFNASRSDFDHQRYCLAGYALRATIADNHLRDVVGAPRSSKDQLSASHLLHCLRHALCHPRSASLITGFLAGSTGTGSAVVYCQYAGYPATCVVRPEVVVAPSHEPRRTPPSIDARPSGLIRQDLFDRNNPNNLRSDWPSPPAQPGQF